jgi:hypothetical protein
MPGVKLEKRNCYSNCCFLYFYTVYKSPLKINQSVGIMGEIRGIVTSSAEEKFRQLAMKKYGYGKGSLSKALEEALNTWIKTQAIEASKQTPIDHFSPSK